MVHKSEDPGLEGWKQKGKEFKSPQSSALVSFWQNWATWDLISKQLALLNKLSIEFLFFSFFFVFFPTSPFPSPPSILSCFPLSGPVLLISPFPLLLCLKLQIAGTPQPIVRWYLGRDAAGRRWWDICWVILFSRVLRNVSIVIGLLAQSFSESPISTNEMTNYTFTNNAGVVPLFQKLICCCRGKTNKQTSKTLKQQNWNKTKNPRQNRGVVVTARKWFPFGAAWKSWHIINKTLWGWERTHLVKYLPYECEDHV